MLVILSGCALLGCGDGEEDRFDPLDGLTPDQDAGTGGRPPTDAATEADVDPACPEEGALRECSVDLGMQGTVHNCFHGWQMCQEGTWSPCVTLEDLGLGDAGG
jgi:hypothetical protein